MNIIAADDRRSPTPFSPETLFRCLALAEVVTWSLLLLGMVLKYVTHTTELGVRVFGGIHGFVFLAYCVVTVLVAVDRCWGAGTTALGLLAAVPPFATLPFERDVERRGLLGDEWRLLHEPPRSAPERAVAAALARPAAAAVIGLVALAGVFVLLLVIGPPVPTT